MTMTEDPKTLITKLMATKVQVTDEEDETRVCNTLPDDVLSTIFTKFGPIQILKTLQLVCRSWRLHSKHPHLYRSLDLRDFNGGDLDKTRAMVDSVLNLSGGELVQFSAGPFSSVNIPILHNVVEKSNSIQRIRLHLDHNLELHKVVDLASKVASIEELDLCCVSSACAQTVKEVGKRCPKLKLKVVQGQDRGYGWCPCTVLSYDGLEITGERRLRLVFSVQAKESEKEQHNDEVTSWIDHTWDKESNIACITTLGH